MFAEMQRRVVGLELSGHGRAEEEVKGVGVKGYRASRPGILGFLLGR